MYTEHSDTYLIHIPNPIEFDKSLMEHNLSFSFISLVHLRRKLYLINGYTKNALYQFMTDNNFQVIASINENENHLKIKNILKGKLI